MKVDCSGPVTRLLGEWSRGNDGALIELMPLVYRDLRRIAGRHLRRERSDHTLQTTALIHEAYLRLAGQRRASWESRIQFFAVAARLMRRILVDHARRRGYAKRGGDAQRVSLEEVPGLPVRRLPELVALDDALNRLGGVHPELIQVVELRYFAGLSNRETAAALGISVPTVTRRWRAARAWLYRELRGGVYGDG